MTLAQMTPMDSKTEKARLNMLYGENTYKSISSTESPLQISTFVHHIAKPIDNFQQRKKATEFEIPKWSAEEVT